jgi:ABC-2 type transport system permease protein
MARHVRLMLLRVHRQFIQWSGAWWSTAMLVIREAITPLLGLFVWMRIMPGDPRVVSYFIALMAIQMMTVSYENHTFSETVYDGTLSHELLKPQPVLSGLIGENIAIRLWMTLVGLPSIGLVVIAFDFHVDWNESWTTAPTVGFAAVLRFLWTYVLALTAFWTQRVHAIVVFGGTMVSLLGGGAVPISLLPTTLQTIVRWLPFYSMLGLPAEISSGMVQNAAIGNAIAFQVGWVAFLAGISLVVWRAGIRRYTAVGA